MQHVLTDDEFMRVFEESQNSINDANILAEQDLKVGMNELHLLIPDEFCLLLERFASGFFSMIQADAHGHVQEVARHTTYFIRIQNRQEMLNLKHDLRKVMVRGLDSEIVRFCHFCHSAMIAMSGLRAMCLYALVENKHAGIIIGRKGQKMREIRERFGVRLEIEQANFNGFDWGRRFSVRDAESFTVARIMSDLVTSISTIIVSETNKIQQANMHKTLRGAPVCIVPPPKGTPPRQTPPAFRTPVGIDTSLVATPPLPG